MNYSPESYIFQAATALLDPLSDLEVGFRRRFSGTPAPSARSISSATFSAAITRALPLEDADNANEVAAAGLSWEDVGGVRRRQVAGSAT